MANETNGKRYDLESRAMEFALAIRDFVKVVPKNITNNEYVKQLVRSSSSIGANYLEANESLSKKDFVMKIKICRKEAKETEYWLRLIEVGDSQQMRLNDLLNEAKQLRLILSAILNKSL